MNPRFALALSALVGLTAAPAVSDAADAQACIEAHEDGIARERDKQLTSSLASYRACADPSCPDVIREACEQKLAEVKQAVPRLRVIVRAPDAHAAKVTINGRVASPAPAPLDPGRHIVEVELGDRRVRRSVSLVEGEGIKELVVAIEPAPSPERPTPGPRARRAGIHPATWVLAAVGGAGLVTFAVAAALGKDKETELVDTCKPRCEKSEIDVMRTRYLVADIGLGVAIAGAVAATVVGLTVESEAEDAASLRLSPLGAHARWRF